MTRVRSELSLLESVFHMFPGFERYSAELKAADYEVSDPHAWLTAIERRPDVPVALWEAVVQCKAAACCSRGLSFSKK